MMRISCTTLAPACPPSFWPKAPRANQMYFYPLSYVLPLGILFLSLFLLLQLWSQILQRGLPSKGYHFVLFSFPLNCAPLFDSLNIRLNRYTIAASFDFATYMPNTLSGREDLNLRPPGPEPGALPGYATPRCKSITIF